MATKKNVESKELVLEQETVKDSKKVSTKKPTEKALKVTKKVTKKAEEQVEEKKPEATKAPMKTVTKKTAAKKTVTKKATVKKEESPRDKFFPETIEVDGTKFSRVKISSWEEFKTFVEACQE